MRLRILRIRVEVDTTEGAFGVDLRLSGGLNIIRADNSAGKSTILAGIIYGLGLEGALTPKHEIPLPYAAVTLLEWEGRQLVVSGSRVWLELEGFDGALASVRREIVGAHPRLMRVWEGVGIDNLEHGKRSDFFVRQPGSATRDYGFHHYLASFTGAQLPEVPTYDGREVPLYFEALFPQFFVEQKQGWGAIRGVYPRWFKIREIHTRTMEYLLSLSRLDVAREHEALLNKKRNLSERWHEHIRSMREAAISVGFSVNGVPQEPQVDEKLLDFRASRRRIEADGRQSAESLGEVLMSKIAKLEELRKAEPKPVGPDSERLQGELQHALLTLKEDEVRVAEAMRERETERASGVELDARIAGVLADLRRYSDIITLKRIGSDLGYTIAKDECPTCGQHVTGTLLPARTIVHTEEQTVAYLKQKEQVFRMVRGQNNARLLELDALIGGLEQSIREQRRNVQSLRETLHRDYRAPSRAWLEQMVYIEEEIASLRRLSERLEAYATDLIFLCREYAEVLGLLAALKERATEAEDEATIANLSKLFRELAIAFGVSPVAGSALGIANDTVEPQSLREDMPVQSDLSASDSVRAAWAFRLALVQVSGTSKGAHPGFLVLDEPRQQSAKIGSFGTLLGHASKIASETGAQILIATSDEQYVELQTQTRNLPITWTVLPHGFVLRPIRG